MGIKRSSFGRSEFSETSKNWQTSLLVTDADVVGTNDVVCWMGEVVVVVLGFVVCVVVVGEVVVFVVDGGDTFDVVIDGAFFVNDGVDLFVVGVGELVFDVGEFVDAGNDVVVTFGDVVEARVVGIVDKSSRG